MLMFTPTPQYGHNGVLVFADYRRELRKPHGRRAWRRLPCVPGRRARVVAGFEPKIAMLSLLHEAGSAKHELVDKVTEATSPGQAKTAPTCDRSK